MTSIAPAPCPAAAAFACLNKQYGQLADACKKVIDVQKKQ